MTHTPTEIAAMIERLAEGVAEVGLADDNCTELYDVESANEAMFEAAAMLRALRKELDEEEALRVGAIERMKAAEAEAAALREALRKAYRALAPAVGEVEITGMLAPPIYRAFGILTDALKGTSDGL